MSEGFEHTGLPPNPAVGKDELDPSNFDHQTVEIMTNRLAKALGVTTPLTFTDALVRIVALNQGHNTLTDADAAAVEALTTVRKDQALQSFKERFQQRFQVTDIDSLEGQVEAVYRSYVAQAQALQNLQQVQSAYISLQARLKQAIGKPEEGMTVDQMLGAVEGLVHVAQGNFAAADRLEARLDEVELPTEQRTAAEAPSPAGVVVQPEGQLDEGTSHEDSTQGQAEGRPALAPVLYGASALREAAAVEVESSFPNLAAWLKRYGR